MPGKGNNFFFLSSAGFVLGSFVCVQCRGPCSSNTRSSVFSPPKCSTFRTPKSGRPVSQHLIISWQRCCVARTLEPTYWARALLQEGATFSINMDVSGLHKQAVFCDKLLRDRSKFLNFHRWFSVRYTICGFLSLGRTLKRMLNQNLDFAK